MRSWNSTITFLLTWNAETWIPLSVDAVVRVALYTDEYMEWGINRLGKILEGLLRRVQTDENYTDYVEDARIVIRGLENIVLGSALEEMVENSKDDPQ